MEQITNGSSNTALLTHLGVNPMEYSYGPTTWYNCNNATGGASVPDNQVPLGAYLSPNSYSPPDLSSPHAGGNLVLFADSHVQSVSNDWLTRIKIRFGPIRTRPRSRRPERPLDIFLDNVIRGWC